MIVNRMTLERALKRVSKDAGWRISDGWQYRLGAPDRRTVEPGSVFIEVLGRGRYRLAMYTNASGGERNLSDGMKSRELLAFLEGVELACLEQAKRLAAASKAVNSAKDDLVKSVGLTA